MGEGSGGWIARIGRLWAALGVFGQVVGTIATALAGVVTILNNYDSLSARMGRSQPPAAHSSTPSNPNLSTSSIDEMRAKDAARLREALAEKRCVEEREKAKVEALVQMSTTQRTYEVCLANYVPSLKELFTGLTAKDRCAPQHEAYRDAERQFQQAAERQCKKAR